MKARQIVEMLAEGAPAPAAPKPKTRPEAPPKPEAPAAPKPKRFDNPWRRRQIRPGEEPAPKARMEAQEPQFSEDRIRAALRDPRLREKIARSAMRPDDGTPEWEDEAVRAVMLGYKEASRRRSSVPASPQRQISGNPEAAARTHMSPQWTEDRIRAALQDPKARKKTEMIIGRKDDGTPKWEDEAVRAILVATRTRASRPQTQVESVRARDLFR